MQKLQRIDKTVFSVFLMHALFASVFTVGKVTLQYTPPFFLTGIRMLLAGVILLSYQWIWNRESFYLSKKHLLPLFVLGLFGVFVTNGFEFWGLQYIDSAKTCLIYSLSPFISIFLSYLFLQERMNVFKWIGLIIGIAGFLPIFFHQSVKSSTLSHFWFFSTAEIAEIAVSISALSCVIGWIAMKKLVKQYRYPFVMANGLSFLLGGMFSLVVSAFLEPRPSFPVKEVMPFLLGLLYISIIHNVICYNIYGYCLQKYTITFMTFAGITSPLFTAFLGWLFLGEQNSLAFFSSLGLISFGLYLFWREENKELTQKTPFAT